MQEEFQENWSSAIKLIAYGTEKINNKLALNLNCIILKVFVV